MNPQKQLNLTRSLAAADAAWSQAREKANADLIASMRQIIAQAITPDILPVEPVREEGAA